MSTTTHAHEILSRAGLFLFPVAVVFTLGLLQGITARGIVPDRDGFGALFLVLRVVSVIAVIFFLNVEGSDIFYVARSDRWWGYYIGLVCAGIMATAAIGFRRYLRIRREPIGGSLLEEHPVEVPNKIIPMPLVVACTGAILVAFLWLWGIASKSQVGT